MRNREQVLDAFTPKEKLSVAQRQILLKMQISAKEMATDAILDVPDCPMRTIGLNKLLEAKQAFAQAITHPDTHLLGVGPAIVGDKNGKAQKQA